MKTLVILLSLVASLAAAPAVEPTPPIQRIGRAVTGTALAVRVADAPLVFTGQLYAADLSGGARAQAEQALDALGIELTKAGSDWARLVRLNVSVSTPEAVGAVDAAVVARCGAALPATTVVLTPLARPGAIVAVDAVGVSSVVEKSVRVLGPSAAVLPAGGKFFISGQAEKATDLGAAVKLTMAGLLRTLQHLGLKPADVVQVKAFVRPVSDQVAAMREISAAFGGAPPPVVFMEWQMDLPTEIELVAAAGALPPPAGDTVAYIALPWLNKSPRYSHVCQVAAGAPLIFIGEVAGEETLDSRGQMKTMFENLGSVLFEAGSTYRTMVKATYFLGDAKTRALLGEIRGVYYDPSRPPAASAIPVARLARPGRLAALDMIAVPAAK